MLKQISKPANGHLPERKSQEVVVNMGDSDDSDVSGGEEMDCVPPLWQRHSDVPRYLRQRHHGAVHSSTVDSDMEEKLARWVGSCGCSHYL